jgi:hypothetical protein
VKHSAEQRKAMQHFLKTFGVEEDKKQLGFTVLHKSTLKKVAVLTMEFDVEQK